MPLYAADNAPNLHYHPATATESPIPQQQPSPPYSQTVVPDYHGQEQQQQPHQTTLQTPQQFVRPRQQPTPPSGPSDEPPPPRISYPDLSGNLTLQPRYPGQFAISSTSNINESYAVYAPASITYYDGFVGPRRPPPAVSVKQEPRDEDDVEEIHMRDDDAALPDQQRGQTPHDAPTPHRRRRNTRPLHHDTSNTRQLQRSSDMHYSTAISMAAQKTRLLGLFWEVFLPNAKPLPTTTLQITLGGAVGAITSFDWDGEILRQGLLAMAMTTVGKKQMLRLAAGGEGAGTAAMENAERMRREGIKLYGKSLQQMSQSLGGKSQWSTTNWVATRLFSLYEVCCPLFALYPFTPVVYIPPPN